MYPRSDNEWAGVELLYDYKVDYLIKEIKESDRHIITIYLDNNFKNVIHLDINE